MPASAKRRSSGWETPVDRAVAEMRLRSLSLGDVDVSIASSDDAWLEQVAVRYGSFLARRAPAGGAIELLYHVEDSSEPSPEALRDARLGGLRSAGEIGSSGADLVELWGDGFRARWFRSLGRLEVWGPRAVYPLDLLLQALWYGCHRQALIVHAAALSDDRRGWLCAGPSGSGKSTLAALVAERALADELVGVLIEDGRAELVALPFWTARPGRVALQAVLSLRHRGSVEPPDGAHHVKRPLTESEALQHLRCQIAWPTWDAAAMGRSLETLARLLEAVPMYELAFSPLPSVWSCISRTEEASP